MPCLVHWLMLLRPDLTDLTLTCCSVLISYVYVGNFQWKLLDFEAEVLAILKLNFDLAFKAEIRSRYWIWNSNQDKADGLALLREKTQECEDVEKFVAKVSWLRFRICDRPKYFPFWYIYCYNRRSTSTRIFIMHMNIWNVSECL